MIQLPPMKYPNTQRTVTGTVDVFPDDVVLNCNTTSGAVTINLAEIPYNATSGQGFWSTQYKLYINDISNNAGTNSITVVAGTGQTINNQASVVINTNGGNAFVIISGNTEYSMFYAPAQAIPANFITVTYAQLSALIAGDDLIAGAGYHVTDAEFGSTPIIPTSIYIQALTTNTVSLSGQGYFLNADYQGVGDYSGVTGFTSQLGVWTTALVTPVGSVVIWDNFQYVNTTGVNGVANPKTDLVNWTVLSRVITNGYVVEISFISYSPTNNRIVSRRDRFNNFVERTVLSLRNSLNFFKWGSVDVRQNTVSKDSVVYNCNATTSGSTSFFGNDFFGSEVILGDGITIGGSVTNWSNNLFETSNVRFTTAGGEFFKNKLNEFTLTGENTNRIARNEFIQSILNNLVNNGEIAFNVFRGLRIFQIDLNTASGVITQNQVNLGNLTITSNKGTIDSNFFDASIVSIVSNEVTGDIVFNRATNNSSIGIATNNSSIQWNSLDSSGQMSIQTVDPLTGVFYFNISNNGRLTLGDVKKRIGAGNKGSGVTISNSSQLEITNFNPAQPTFYNNIITNGSEVIIVDYETTSFFQGNTIDSTGFYTTDLNGKIVNNNFFKGVTFGGVAPTIAFPTDVIGKTAMSGNSNVEFELDCSSPSIYDLPTQRLIIDAYYQDFAGIYKLTNAGGLTIALVGNLQEKWVTQLYTATGTTTFQGVAIAGAVAEEIVSSSGAVAFNITNHALGYDSLFVISSETLTVIRNTNILV